MSTDKRQVATDALDTLGTLISDDEKRDAIHLAVEPVVAAHTLRPGDHVGRIPGGFGLCDKPVGIVDPFLPRLVFPGDRFWLLVYPGQITSLRHVWTHEDLDSTPEVTPAPTESEATAVVAAPEIAKPVDAATSWETDDIPSYGCSRC